MFRAVESRAAAAAALATIFHLSNLQADDLLAECEAFIRAVHRLSSSGLPAEVETLAWLVREAGGHEVAAAMELTYRKDPR
ncbi:hypothetical protein DEU34_2521 [Microbacterium sp. AG1240]|nr:hypothetical protein DEU34_2521 [Microbacterium sp. AG1240]